MRGNNDMSTRKLYHKNHMTTWKSHSIRKSRWIIYTSDTYSVHSSQLNLLTAITMINSLSYHTYISSYFLNYVISTSKRVSSMRLLLSRQGQGGTSMILFLQIVLLISGRLGQQMFPIYFATLGQILIALLYRGFGAPFL